MKEFKQYDCLHLKVAKLFERVCLDLKSTTYP